jgi:16S rRNA (cytidine1402-2'-O)-methyltransferase
LKDITLRALDVLKDVDLIACEDTRNTRTLLNRRRISTKLISLHRFSESKKTAAILERLAAGEDIALVSDAGTPVISDPGDRLVVSAREAGFNVVPIPGPSAISTALSVSGMNCSSYLFLGYVPRKEAQRKEFFIEILLEERTVVFFESPKRIQAALEIADSVLADRKMILFREMTKIHEEALLGTAREILAALNEKPVIKGEIVVVVEGPAPAEFEIDLDAAVNTLIEEGFTGKRLANEAKRRFGVGKGEAYARFLSLKEAGPEDSTYGT